MSDEDLSISLALEQLALALGDAGAVPRGDLIRALERAAERLRIGGLQVGSPTDVVSQAEAARFVGVSRQAVNQWVRKGLVATYSGGAGNGRSTLVSLAEIAVTANRWRGESVSMGFRGQLTSFLELLTKHGEIAPLASAVESAVQAGETSDRDEDAARVLREFLVAAMGTEGAQEEFTQTGVQMLADLRPNVVVDAGLPFGALLDRLGLLIHSADGSAGFDSASAAILGLLGAATVGARTDGREASLGELVTDAAQQVWGEDWVRRLFDAAYHADELVSPTMTRYTAPLVYLGCNRFMRQAQADGVSITYAMSPGAVLPQSYHGAPVLSEMLAGHRHAVPPWEFRKGSTTVRAALQRSAKSPFRVFNFEYGLFDDSIHGIRRYCYSMRPARDELHAFLDQLPRSERSSYVELAIETFAHVLEKTFVEAAAVEPPHVFDWWKQHIIRCSPRETLIGLRGDKARRIAHGLLVRSSLIPQILAAGHEDPELRERLRVYAKNLDYEFADERYRDDLARGTTRLVKSGAEDLSRDAALARAEIEVKLMLQR